MTRKILLAFLLSAAMVCGLPGRALALDYVAKRLLNGVVRLDVTRMGGIPDVGSGIIVAVEGDRAYLVTALHVLTGPEDERNTSGWERHTAEIGIRVRFFGDPVSYQGRLAEPWNERKDIAVIVVEDTRLGMTDLAVGFGVGSPMTLARPYPAMVIGHGGSKDWDMLDTRVTAVNGADIRLSTRQIEPGDSGGALIDMSRNVLIGMVVRTSQHGGEAVSAEFIISELDSWGIAHHLRVARTSSPMVRVPAGYFKMGAGVPGQPSMLTRDIYLDSYFIDQFEVTVADYRRFVKAAHYRYTADVVTCNFAHQERGNFPMNCVTWNDAEAYCKWAGKALPTEAQWEKAARGPKGNVFPWGSAPLSKDDVAIRTEWPVAVGSYPRDRSFYGAKDMLGNVSEWVADRYSSYPLPQLAERNPTGPTAGTSRDRVLRGGSFKTTPQNAHLAIRKRNLPDFGRMRFDYGFRCVLNEAK